MLKILMLFSKIAIITAFISMFLPMITDFIARRGGIAYSNDLKLFAVLYYYSLIIQIIATVLASIFHSTNVFIFHFYSPVQIVILSYLLLKWNGIKQEAVLIIAGLFGLITISGDILFSSLNEFPDFMLWFTTLILFLLSFLLSYSNDKKKIYLTCENNYIHVGIYIYSIITLIGISPANTEIRIYGYFFQALALIFSNIYFARSFRCLYQKNG